MRETATRKFSLFLFATHRKYTFKTQTVIQMDKVTRIMVNNKYFPSKGMASDVGGIISANSKKNTVSERRMEEHSDTYTRNTTG